MALRYIDLVGIWRQRARRLSLLGAAFKLIAAQETQLRLQEQQLLSLQRLILEAQRATRDVAVGARLAAAEGVDITEDLDLLIADLSDQIANLEEHIPVSW